jgi:Tol biopolymer transport system component
MSANEENTMPEVGGRLKITAVSLLTAVAVLGCQFQLRPGKPPPEPRIVFTSERDGNTEIYVMNADGSNQQNLTNNPDWDLGALASPDGQKIAYSSGKPRALMIHVMDADGGNPTPLTKGGDMNWSPDGTRLAYNHEADIHVIGVDGRGRTRLTDDTSVDAIPIWSPDGQIIAFYSERGGSNGIYFMRPDGTDVRQFMRLNKDDWPTSWSPDGTKLLFNSNAGDGQEVGLIDIEQREVTILTTGGASGGRFSPDGQSILFESMRDGDLEIYLMHLDGGEVTRLTHSPGMDLIACWLVQP